MKAVLLAGAMILAAAILAMPGRAAALTWSDVQPLPPSVCRDVGLRLLRTAATGPRRIDCCPADVKCAGHLGTSIPPEPRTRLRG
ncbi:conserved exported protein of unknown function [Rhodovastum atsumiense]|uniref:DUF3551 domain-containing protein n=1 Tax=Rhodovastum atsumiense TaxID=504468 RepID=A0A5M6IQE7_9PROT|nr:hypothetical protein [Rhodovastum atsumiense]KAA5610500.1 hypothetical protein F1189_19300 [Rhodovastum atsumiense]CAH2600487.1 conserved exported protein of unknown function [Rhodovastum atsumiense]